MTTKLLLSIAIRLLLFLRMTCHGFILKDSNHNIALQQQTQYSSLSLIKQRVQKTITTNKRNRLPLEPLFVISSTPSSSSSYNNDLDLIESSTLRQLYPKLVAWKEEYGNPNIPLNSEGGRQCQLVRRLHIQQKLRPGEIELLENLGFIFLLTLEDLYYEADFDDMYNRISNYQRLHPKDSIPKKYRPDPELGAWATGLRRLGPDNVRPEHVQKLAQINFQWKSSSPCGSKFMLEFRDLVEKVRLYGRDYLDTEDVQKWISKQRSNRLKKKMSDTRYHYMIDLIGNDWMTEEKE